MKNRKSYINEIKPKVEIPIVQHGTKHLFKDIFMFGDYTCRRKFVCTLLWLAKKLAANFLKPAVRQKKYGLGVSDRQSIV